MTKDEIIRMAREAGLMTTAGWNLRDLVPALPTDDYQIKLERFAALVAADLFTYDQVKAHIQAAVISEREACAKVCEETELPFDIDLWHNSTKKEMTAHTAHGLAAAIRARNS